MNMRLLTKRLKVALVYDWVDKFGGAERLLLELRRIFPEVHLFTSVYNPKLAPWAKQFGKIIPSWLSSLPGSKKHERLTPLIPVAFESFDFSGYDLVISVSSAFAKGVITKPPTRHICYCLSPTRFLWQDWDVYLQALPKLFQPAWQVTATYLRLWDQMAAFRPDVLVAISQQTARGIRKYYRREVEAVISPPVDTEKFCLPRRRIPVSGRDYFLVVSRLVPYKRVNVIVEAFNLLNLPLVVVGTGTEEQKLKRIAKPNIKFLGSVSEGRLISLYQKAISVIVPQEEDFGLVPLEANACGTPVVAFRGGGVLETVKEGISGTFFSTQDSDDLRKTIELTDFSKFSPEECRENSLRFSQAKFDSDWRNIVAI